MNKCNPFLYFFINNITKIIKELTLPILSSIKSMPGNFLFFRAINRSLGGDCNVISKKYVPICFSGKLAAHIGRSYSDFFAFEETWPAARLFNFISVRQQKNDHHQTFFCLWWSFYII